MTGLLATVGAGAALLATGAVGTVIGTRLLADLSPRTASLVLSLFILLFVAVSASGRSPRVPSVSERWVSPLVGLVVGVVGGVTNVHGTPLVMYFVALGLAKHDFVAAVSFTFVVYKLVQLGAVAYFHLSSARPSRRAEERCRSEGAADYATDR